MRRYCNFSGIGRRAHQCGRILSINGQPSRSKSFISKSLREPIGTAKFARTNSNLTKMQEDGQNDVSNGASMTKLSNGLTVASVDHVGRSCSLGVIVNAAAKDECHHPSGVSHFLEKLAFSGTEAFPTHEELVEEMVRCGGVVDCQSGKDVTIYAMSGKTEEAASLVKLLGEVVLRPRITDEEVEAARGKVEHELLVTEQVPPPENILSEMIHKAAFNRNTYGLPKLCPPENLYKISRSDLLKFLAAHYRPDHMVVAAAGVPHETLVRSVEEHFLSDQPSAWAGVTAPEPKPSVGQYTGGYEVRHRDLAAYHHPMPEFAHVVLGLEACSSTDPQYVATAVLQMLMGGGGSFSAGGPGKGMFTRLFVKVLNHYHWVNSAVAHLHTYNDAGLFTISGSAEPRFIGDLVQVIASEMRNMAGPISEQELARAKRQLQSMLLMNLEYRPVVMEDLGRQIFTYGERKSPEWWVDEIERVREDDVRDVAQRMLQSKPSVVGFGRVDNLPPYDALVRLLKTKEKFIPRIFNVYK